MAISVTSVRTVRNTLFTQSAPNGDHRGFLWLFGAYGLCVLYDFLLNLSTEHPFYFMIFAQEITTIIMILCFLIVRSTVPDLGYHGHHQESATILGCFAVYHPDLLVMIYSLIRLINMESDLIRFMALAISVILFLVLRDRMQRWIDQLFHRENYDSATVVSEFEEKLAGIYKGEELKEKIAKSLDEIFHFKSFVLCLKNDGKNYQPAFVIGMDGQQMDEELTVNRDMDKMLRNLKYFLPANLIKSCHT